MSLLRIKELESQLARRDERIIELENKLIAKNADEFYANLYKWIRQHHVDSSHTVTVVEGLTASNTMHWVGGKAEELDTSIIQAMTICEG